MVYFSEVPTIKLDEGIMGRDIAMLTRGKLNPTTRELCYFAGVLDSDGCISIGKMRAGNQRTSNPRYVLTICVVNTSLALMDWLIEKFGGAVKARRQEKAHHRVTYNWHYNNGKAAGILELVEPYLIVKKEQARIGLDLISEWKTNYGRGAKTDAAEVIRRERLYLEMKRLNQTGLVSAAATTNSLGSCDGSQDDVIV